MGRGHVLDQELTPRVRQSDESERSVLPEGDFLLTLLLVASLLALAPRTRFRFLIVASENQIVLDKNLGVLELKLTAAKVFAEAYSGTGKEGEMDGNELKEGDYYIRISSNRRLVDPGKRDPTDVVGIRSPRQMPASPEPVVSEDTSRTHVEYGTGNPTFESNFSFVVFDPGQVFKIDLVDARIDQVLGVIVLGAQEILQFQRDLYVQTAGKKASTLPGGLFFYTFKSLLNPPQLESEQLKRKAFFRVSGSGAAYRNKDVYSVGFFNKNFTDRPMSAGFLDFEANLKENSR